MENGFSGRRLIDIAIGIERRGITFYDVIAKSTENPEARVVFEGLVLMEREHIKIFEDILGEEGDQPVFAEDSGYIDSLIEEAVFTDDAITSEMALQADSDVKAVELGIIAEKDSILFYYEMRDRLPALAPAINRVIAEEKSHLQQLSDIKRKLAGP
jgi:rubrerythrin